VVRLLRALVRREAPPLREVEERDSLVRLRWLPRPLLEARPRALEDFFAWASRPRSDLPAEAREPPPLERELLLLLRERELRNDCEPEELRRLREEPEAVRARDDEPPREEDWLP
jgi:hypothetical protein